MSRKAKLLAAGALTFAFVALGVAWFRANSMTAKDACINNLGQIDDAMRQASSNSPPVATNLPAPRP